MFSDFNILIMDKAKPIINISIKFNMAVLKTVTKYLKTIDYMGVEP